jgi:hypothetical protein
MAEPNIRLQAGENIVEDMLPSAWWTLSLYVFTLGLWAIWRGHHHFVLTNQRVVIAKGIVNKSEKAVALGRIQDTSLSRSILSGGRVRLSSAGGPLSIESIGPLTREDARKFADAINSMVATSHSDGLGVPQPARLSLAPLPPNTPASWMPDPSNDEQLRYWDGNAWTEHVEPKGDAPAS